MSFPLRFLMLVALIGLMPWRVGAQERVLSFRVIDHDLKRYQAYVGERDPVGLPLRPEGLNRHVAEMLLFAVAPVVGGCGCRIEFLPFGTETTHARVVAELVSGRTAADTVAGFVSDQRYGEAVMFSEPALAAEDFQVGFYTHRDRKDVLQTQSAEAIRRLRFVVGARWDVDRQVLARRGLSTLLADDWSSALRQIRAGRADVMLQPFSSRFDMALGDRGLEAEFVPIPGWRMGFGHARQYTFSRRHPDGPWLFSHFDEGLRRLRQQGYLDRLWRAAGVIDPRVQTFQELR